MWQQPLLDSRRLLGTMPINPQSIAAQEPSMINDQHYKGCQRKIYSAPGNVLVASLALLLMSDVLRAAEEDKIATDRPDFVESSFTVGKNRFQFEASIAFDAEKSGTLEENTYTTPTLLRYGIADVWEVRLETDGPIHYETRETSTGITTLERGTTDMSLGMKWHTQDEAETGLRPSLAWIYHVDIPSGSNSFRGNGMSPSVRAVMEWELSEFHSLGIMPGIIHDKYVTGERFTAGILGIVLGQAWTEKFRTLIELAAARITEKKYGGSVVFYNVAGAYLLTNMIQADMSMSWGASDAAPDFSWSLGLSARF